MSERLRNKTALVTGSTSNIGQAAPACPSGCLH